MKLLLPEIGDKFKFLSADKCFEITRLHENTGIFDIFNPKSKNHSFTYCENFVRHHVNKLFILVKKS